MFKQALILGCIFAALGVILGAFGAHALKTLLTEEQIKIFETGVRYQFYHSFALLITGIVYREYHNKLIKLASNFFVLGIILFSGSLYTMTIMYIKGIPLGTIGAITPLGGLCFITGWVLLLICIFKE